MTLAQKTELNEILKLSAEHARNCTIDHYLTNAIYEMQIEKFADWIDPTIDYTDEILSEKYKPEDFL